MTQLARTVAFALALCALAPAAPRPADAAATTRPALAVTTPEERSALAELLSRDALLVDGHTLDVAALRRLYAEFDNDLLWSDGGGRAAALSAAYAADGDDGLDLPVPLLNPFKIKTDGAVERDLVLSDGALRLASALAVGRVRPEEWEGDWAVPAPRFDAVAALAKALRADRLGPFLAELPPRDPRYVRLKQALAHYRELAARRNWPLIPRGPTLKPGMTDERIGIIRERLVAEGYLPGIEAGDPAPDPVADNTYDAALEEGVKRFQTEHGIVPDSAVGVRTVAAMNVGAHARVEQIALTLERWRSLPRDFGRNYVFVNVPAESLEVFDDSVPVLSMKVVVGDPDHPTPVVQTRISAITFNPAWHIPTSIGRNEIAPKLKADPDYLEKNGMIMKGAYLFEQLPGPKNALGQVKFETPNKFDVYLHDTSSHGSFARVARALSHGCVRVEDARALAAYVLDGPKWNPDEIAKVIDSAATERVDVVRHLRVSILYFTSFVDPDGTVEFRDDIYGRDKRLRAALKGELPAVAIVPKAKPGII